jgi:hypothetical protein
MGRSLPSKRGATEYLCLITIAAGICALGETSWEDNSKALFLLRIAQYVEWPAEAFPDQTGPFVFGVLGSTSFESRARDTIQGRNIRGRQVKVEGFKELDGLERCHLLYVARSENARLKLIFESVRGRPVLTTSEVEDFAKLGGVIGVRAEGNGMKFKINHEAARASGLVISARLLKAAEEVIDHKPGD